MVMIRLVAIAILIVFSPAEISDSHIEKPIPKPEPVKVAKSEEWNIGKVTVYANYFEGRTMANGRTFRHRDHVVACRGGKLGRKIEIRYGVNGKSTAIISDRGGLPLHQEDEWQFDVTKQVARELGLYRIDKNGKTDRTIKWRYIN